MREQLLKHLSPITKEEQNYLDGKKSIEYELYGKKGELTVEAQKLLKSGKLVEIRPHTRFIHFPPHRHNYIEMVYMFKGSTTHIVNHQKVALNEGDLLFLNRSAVQEILPATKDDLAINFIILPEFFNSLITLLEHEKTPLHDFLLDSLLGNSSNCDYLYFNVASVAPIQNLVENLMFYILKDDNGHQPLMGKTMALLFLELMHHTDAIASENSDFKDKLTVDVLKYIDVHYREATLTELSATLNYDLYWLSKEIKKQTKKTFKELLKEKRLSVAKHLLKHSSLSIDEIIMLIGYENTSYFYRLFKEEFNVSPKTYRQGESQ